MPRQNCGIELDSLPLLASCPADSETMLFMGATGGQGAGGYARRTWQKVRNCILSQLKIIFANGDEFEGNTYNNASLAGMDLVVYYNGLGFLVPLKLQIEILETGGFIAVDFTVFTNQDDFVIFPNGPI